MVTFMRTSALAISLGPVFVPESTLKFPFKAMIMIATSFCSRATQRNVLSANVKEVKLIIMTLVLDFFRLVRK
jgi:hypothetical protein